MSDLLFEAGGWIECKTIFGDLPNEGRPSGQLLSVVRGKVIGVDADSVRLYIPHDAIGLMQLRLKYIKSFRRLSESEALGVQL